MSRPDIYTFIDSLWEKGIYTLKQLGFLENIYIYMDDLRIYKIVLAAYPKELRKALKRGITSQYTIFEGDYGKIAEPVPGTKHGKYMIQYSPASRKATLYEGEVHNIIGLARPKNNKNNIKIDTNENPA